MFIQLPRDYEILISIFGILGVILIFLSVLYIYFFSYK